MESWLVLQIQIGIVVLLALVLQGIMKKVPRIYSYVLWVLVFVRLLCPITIESGFGLVPSGQQWHSLFEQYTEPKGEEASLMNQQGNWLLGDDALIGNIDNIHNMANQDSMTQSDGAQNALTQNSTAKSNPAQGDLMQNYAAANRASQKSGIFTGFSNASLWLVAIWLIGAVGILLYNGITMGRIRKDLKDAKLQEENVYVSDKLGVPFTIGIRKPRIYIPSSLGEGEREYILCHERVHIRRKDYLIKNVAFLLTSLYWYNPFAWVAFHFLEQSMEMSCDEAVVKVMGEDIKKSYSQSLLNFAIGKGKRSVMPLTFSDNSVKRRIKNVLSYKGRGKWGVLAGVVIVLIAGSVFFTTRTTTEEEPQDNSTDVVDNKEEQPTKTDLTEEDKTNIWRVFERWVEDLSGRAQTYGFAQSSPWLWENNYTIRYEEGDDEVVFRYVMQNSAPEYYIALETAEVVKENGQYSLKFKDFTMCDVSSKEEFEKAYGESPSYDFSPFRGTFIHYIYQHLKKNTNPEYYNAYLDPLSAAITTLHLEAGEGEVVYLDEAKSMANVIYHFKDSQTEVTIPMRMEEPELKIWVPWVGDSTWTVVFEELEVDNVIYQATRIGIYRISGDLVEWIYPKFVGTNPMMRLWGGRLYFKTDLGYSDGALDWVDTGICWVDPETKETGVVPLTIKDRTPMIGGFSIYSGFLFVSEYGKPDYITMLLSEEDKKVYKGKTAAKLTEEEQQDFGMENSQWLLDNPGKLLELSIRTLENTYVLLDANLDGKTEKIVLTAEGNFSSNYMPLDMYRFEVENEDGTMVSQGEVSYAESLNNSIWAISLDGESIQLILYEDGPSGDPYTRIYQCTDKNQLRLLDGFTDDIRRCEINDKGEIRGTTRCDLIQTDWIEICWELNKQGKIVQQKVKEYDFVCQNDVELLIDLPVYEKPGAGNSYTISPQTVRFCKCSGDYNWIQLETQTGQKAWFQIDGGSIPGVTENKWDAFSGLNMAD